MFVLKIIISFGIIGVSSYIGFLKSNKLKSREYILREMVTFLGLVENEIRYMLSVLPNAYESSRQKLNTKLKDVIGNIAVDMLKHENSYLIEESIVKNINALDCLKDYDRNVFISILKNLGRSDMDSQINIIENGIKTLENQIKEANEVKLKNTKLYRTVGTITGIMIVVIFI